MERDEFLRTAWRVMVAGMLDPKQLVFVDEMGANTALCPLYAWSRRGERVHINAPRNRGPNITLLSSMSVEGMGPSLAVEGSTNPVVFEHYLEKILTPTLEPGQIVVMDNLSAHKAHRVRKLIEDRGCELLYLPPYSPDLNSIEEAVSKVKRFLRTIGARTLEALVEAIGKAIGAVTANDTLSFFTHCGYRPLEQ